MVVMMRWRVSVDCSHRMRGHRNHMTKGGVDSVLRQKHTKKLSFAGNRSYNGGLHSDWQAIKNYEAGRLSVSRK